MVAFVRAQMDGFRALIEMSKMMKMMQGGGGRKMMEMMKNMPR